MQAQLPASLNQLLTMCKEAMVLPEHVLRISSGVCMPVWQPQHLEIETSAAVLHC